MNIFYIILGSVARKEQTAVEQPRSALLSRSQSIYNQLPTSTQEGVQQTKHMPDDLRYAGEDFQQPEARFEEPLPMTTNDVSQSLLDGLFDRELPVLRQKRGYSICDIKYPSIYEILQFLRTRKLCGIKTGYFRFGVGK